MTEYFQVNIHIKPMPEGSSTTYIVSAHRQGRNITRDDCTDYRPRPEFEDIGFSTGRPQIIKLGQLLYQFLLSENSNVGRLWRETCKAAQDRSANNKSTRTILRIEITENANVFTLQKQPWELLCSEKEEFLAHSSDTPIVRRIEEQQSTVRPRETLRLLVGWAQPNDKPMLELHNEYQRIEQALKQQIDSKQIKLEVVPNATKILLREKIREFKPHIFHFAGHGELDTLDGQGALLLNDPEGKADPLDATALTTWLVGRQIRVVVLNACMTAAVSDRGEPFLGVAQALAKKIPAVIAMQHDIPDRIGALPFAGEFYRSLADGETLPTAVTQARVAMFALPHTRSGQRHWSTPVLYLQSGALVAQPLLPRQLQGPATRPESATQVRPGVQPVLPRPEPPAPQGYILQKTRQQSPNEHQPLISAIERAWSKGDTQLRELEKAMNELTRTDSKIASLAAQEIRDSPQQTDKQKQQAINHLRWIEIITTSFVAGYLSVALKRA